MINFKKIIPSNSLINFKNKLDPWLVIIALISITVRAFIPENINLDSPHDDYLGVRLASALLHGNWLGHWDNTTLLKPPMYSFFLFVAHWIPIKTVVLVQILLLGSFLWFAKIASGAQIESKTYQTSAVRVIFAILALNPLLFSASFSRIYRNQIYVILLCYLFVSTLALLIRILLLRDQIVINRINMKKFRDLYILAAFFGFICSSLIMTREESVWLIGPCLIMIFCAVLINLFACSQSSKAKQVWGLKIYFSLVVLVTIFFSSPIILVKEINRHVYGASLLQNFSSGQFDEAMKLWSSVSDGKDTRLFIPITETQRKVVYSISQTAQKLQPYLDNIDPNLSPVNFWVSFNCSATKVCDNAGGAWFPFQLRDAAVLAGNISSEREFQDFFRKISEDISIACKNKIIACSRPGTGPGVTNINDFPKKQLFSNSVNVLHSWFSFSPMADGYINNGNDSNKLKTWHSVIDFDTVYVPNADTSWVHLQPLLDFLTTLYRQITLLLFFGCLVLFIKRKKEKDPSNSKIFISVGSFSLLLYCLGIGILTAAWGFSALGIYAIPAQPIFLMVCLAGCVSLVRSIKQ